MIALQLVAGGALLIIGADLLVRGASRIALALGLTPLVIGLTVVAFGTSAPELAVSLGATFSGAPDIAVGNVVGSNIFNVLFILGLSALVVPLVVEKQLVRLDVPIMIAASVALLFMARDGVVGRLNGAVLFAALIGYIVFLMRSGGNGSAQAPAAPPGDPTAGRGGIGKAALIALAGLALLIIGSDFFVDGAVTLARTLGVSEIVIGLTIIAGGTSLPELATSVLASIRGERDIAVGNVVGSNIFNILGILGLCGLVAPEGLRVAASVQAFDGPVMLAVAVATLPIFFSGYRINRGEGLIFLGYYIAYTAWLVLNATQHDALAAYGRIMLLFVLPITVLTIGVIFVRAVRTR